VEDAADGLPRHTFSILERMPVISRSADFVQQPANGDFELFVGFVAARGDLSTINST
jgi:hypothetical protein